MGQFEQIVVAAARAVSPFAGSGRSQARTDVACPPKRDSDPLCRAGRKGGSSRNWVIRSAVVC